MKMLRNPIILIFLTITVTSCLQIRKILYPLKRKEINHRIKLHDKIPSDNYITYENKSIIVYLSRHDILEIIKTRIDNPEECALKVQRYNNLFNQIDSLKTNGYVIESSDLTDYQGYIFTLKSVELSKYSFESYWDDYVLKTNYGFEPQFLDTSAAIRINYFYDWIVSSLIISGNATLIRKSNNEIQEKVILRRVDLKDGHGMDDLLFSDEKCFFGVNFHSDMIFPDFECMENDEIKTFIGN